MDRYEIKVVGHLDSSRARALGATRLRLLAEGHSSFVVQATDAAALYGLLSRLRDAGLTLVALTRIPSVPADPHATSERSDSP